MTKKDYELIAAVIRNFCDGHLDKSRAACLRLDFLIRIAEHKSAFRR